MDPLQQRSISSNQYYSIASNPKAQRAKMPPWRCIQSDLFDRRAAQRAQLRKIDTEAGVWEPKGTPLLAPVQFNNYHPKENVILIHDIAPQRSPYPSTSWPDCPVDGHDKCFHGEVYYYADVDPGRQQVEMLRKSGFGAEFFDCGNPPPNVWAALLDVCEGRVTEQALNMLYAYRFNHCPRRRRQIIEERLKSEREEAIRRRREAIGLLEHAQERRLANIDAVMSEQG